MTQVSLHLQRVKCPLCGGDSQRGVVETGDVWYGVPGTFVVVRCQNCGHEFMNPQPDESSLEVCYPSGYEPHAQPLDAAASQQPPRANPLIRLLRSVPGLRTVVRWLLNDLSQPVPSPEAAAENAPHAVELGCAAGRYLQALQQAGWAAEGIELCEGPAQAAIAQGLKVHRGTLQSAAVPAQSAEMVAAWMVLEHVADPGATLNELRLILRPGGLLLLSIPNARCWQRFVFGRHWYGWDLPRHLQHFSPRSIRRLLLECGFTDIHIQHQRTLLSLMGSIGLVLQSVAPGNRPGQWFLRYPDQPKLFVQLLLAPLAVLLSWLGQGERLTVRAVARQEPPAEAQSQAAIGPDGSR